MGDCRRIEGLRLSRSRRASPGQAKHGYSALGAAMSSFVGRSPIRQSLHLPVEPFDALTEVVLANVHNAHLAPGVVFGVAGVGGIDHDGLAKLAPDGAGRGFGWVGGAEHIADLAYGSNTFVNQGNALLRTGRILFGQRTFRGRAARHEPDYVLELVIAKRRAKDSAQLMFLVGADLEAHFLLNRRFGFRRYDILELRAQRLADGAIKLQSLRHAHPVNLHAHNEQAGAGEEIDHVTGPASGEAEVLWLDQHQRPLRLLPGLIGNDVLQDAAVRVRVVRPELELRFSLIRGRGSQHCRLEITQLVILVDDQIAIGVPNGLPAAPVRADIAHDRTGLAHGIFTLE